MGDKTVRDGVATHAWVIMGNDFPSAVALDEASAEAEVSALKALQVHMPDWDIRKRIYWRHDKQPIIALSSANARAKAAEEGLLHPWAHGDKLFYDMDGVPIRATYFGNDEGWAAVTFDADDPNSGPIAVRPSRLSARATLAKLEVRG